MRKAMRERDKAHGESRRKRVEATKRAVARRWAPTLAKGTKFSVKLSQVAKTAQTLAEQAISEIGRR